MITVARVLGRRGVAAPAEEEMFINYECNNNNNDIIVDASPGVVTDRDQTHSPSCDLRNAIALIAHTNVRGSYNNA
jgi:hypothetical protein